MLAGLLGGALALVAPVEETRGQTRIGRLFSTPEQRVELDRLRDDPRAAEDAEPSAESVGRDASGEPAPVPPARAVTLNGVIVRGGVLRAAWIDGVESDGDATTRTGARVEADRSPGGRLRIRLSNGRTSAVLAPGQSIDTQGKVREAYQGRAGGTPAGTPDEHATGE